MRKEILAVAVGELGYKEGRNNATKYGHWYGMDNNPWCAMFVSWCAAQAGVPVTIVPKLAYVPYYYSFYVASSRYKSRESGYVPQPGDLVLFGDNDHIGFVESASGGKLVTIEGNTSSSGNSSNGDGVYRRTRNLSDGWIKGYCLPEYKEEEMEVKPIFVMQLDRQEAVSVNAVNIEGSNYVRLRDVEKLLPCRVSWDGKNPTISSTAKEHQERVSAIDI